MRVAANPQALAAAAAEWMLAALLARSGPVSVALSGGSTPKLLYETLAAAPFRDRMPWGRVHWFWGDERFVSHDDPRSNYRMTMDAMLRHVPAPVTNIHPVPTEGLVAEAAAQQYEAELLEFHGGASLDQPLFDVVLMGLGTNGHTASLFPDTTVLQNRTDWAAAVTPEGEPTRITLTYPALESCRHAAFLVAGVDKREVLARVRGGDLSLPATHYRPQGELAWFADEAAS